MDGRAGVFALVPAAADPTQHERVQIGTLHLVMSLEEAGPAELPADAGAAVAAAAGPAALPTLAGAQTAAAVAAPAGAHSRPASAAGAVQQAAGGGGERQQLGAQPPALATAAAAGLPSAGGALAAVAARGGAPAPAVLGTNSLVAGPEFEAAWELELWKKEEEAKWRRELKEREARRMVGAGKWVLVVGCCGGGEAMHSAFCRTLCQDPWPACYVVCEF